MIETTKDSASEELVVPNRAGLHARVSTMLAKKAMEFTSDICFRKGTKGVANARSVLDLLSLGAMQGEKLTVEASGADAQAAVQAIAALFRSRFDEDETVE